MLYPVCPTCGFLLADKELEIIDKINKVCSMKKEPSDNNNSILKILDEYKINKYCCRMRIITYVDLAKTIL